MRTRAAIIALVAVSVGAVASATCADPGGKPGLTAPPLTPSRDLAAPTDAEATGAGRSEILAQPADAEALHAAAGARASGYAETVSTFSGDISKYSFIVLTTSPVRIGGPFFPYFPSKGEVQGTIVHTTGGVTVTQTIHADIDCSNFVNIPIPIFGRMAIASGPVKHWTRDGEPVPFPPGQEVLITVQDNGEGGNSPPDRASSLIPVTGRLNCRDLFLLMFPSEQGNIQVVFPGERGNNGD